MVKKNLAVVVGGVEVAVVVVVDDVGSLGQSPVEHFFCSHTPHSRPRK